MMLKMMEAVIMMPMTMTMSHLIWLIESKRCKICHKAFHEKNGSFTRYNGHEIRFITFMLQSSLSYTPIESIGIIGTICSQKQ